MDIEQLKKWVAEEAVLRFCSDHQIIGVGTGSTVYHLINALATIKVKAAIASSEATKRQLISLNIPIVSLNSTGIPALYIDGADAVDTRLRLIKGRGGALSREKVIAYASQKFVCIIDRSKWVESFCDKRCPPISVEVLPMARTYVERQLRTLGGHPVYREGFITDNGNKILDVGGLELSDPLAMEHTLNQIAGTVANGIFAQRVPDIVLLADSKTGIQTLEPALTK